MKNLLCLFSLLLIFSCSTEEVALEKEIESFTPELNSINNNKNLIKPSFGCTNPLFIAENSVPSSANHSIDINWNNFFIMILCDSIEGKIEVFADGITNPNTNLPQDDYPSMQCYGDISLPISGFVPIDFFNTNTYTLKIPDFGTKCLWWRIVLEGRDCGYIDYDCETTTTWHFVSTYDL